MPTASEFRARAAGVEIIVGALTNKWSAIERRRAEPGLSGGRIADAVDTTLAASVANTSELARRCDAVVEELRRRARLCEQFTVEMSAYERSHGRWAARRRQYYEALGSGGTASWPGPFPTRPTPPFPGAEAG